MTHTTLHVRATSDPHHPARTGGWCTLTPKDVVDIKIEFRPGGDSKFSWPDHLACLMCPRCGVEAKATRPNAAGIAPKFMMLYVHTSSFEMKRRECVLCFVAGLLYAHSCKWIPSCCQHNLPA